jgi:hypothetical protein
MANLGEFFPKNSLQKLYPFFWSISDKISAQKNTSLSIMKPSPCTLYSSRAFQDTKCGLGVPWFQRSQCEKQTKQTALRDTWLTDELRRSANSIILDFIFKLIIILHISKNLKHHTICSLMLMGF